MLCYIWLYYYIVLCFVILLYYVLSYYITLYVSCYLLLCYILHNFTFNVTVLCYVLLYDTSNINKTWLLLTASLFTWCTFITTECLSQGYRRKVFCCVY